MSLPIIRDMHFQKLVWLCPSNFSVVMIKYPDENNIRETVFGFRIIVLGVVPFIIVHMAEAKKNF